MSEHFIKNPQKVRAADRHELFPRDFQESLRFWRRLGLTSTVRGDVGARTASLKGGDFRLTLVEDPSRERDPPPTGPLPLRIVLAVRDFEEYVAALREKGAEVPPPSLSLGARRAVELVDPDGLRVLIESDDG